MKLISTRILALAAASLAFASCSSEPSDWRPDDKVSHDMVAPGTRVSGGVDPEDAEAGRPQAANEAVGVPPSSNVNLDDKAAASAEGAMSANAEEGMRKRGLMNDAGKSSQADTTAGGHEVQR